MMPNSFLVPFHGIGDHHNKENPNIDSPDEGDLKCTNVALVFSFSSCLMSSSGECLANEEDRNALTKMILELKGHEVHFE